MIIMGCVVVAAGAALEGDRAGVVYSSGVLSCPSCVGVYYFNKN